MKDVAIVGAGMTPCRSRWVFKDVLGTGANGGLSEAVHDAAIHIQEVEAGVAGIYNDISEFFKLSPSQGCRVSWGFKTSP